MKATLFAPFVALLMVGCGESSNPSEGVDMTDAAPKKDAIETAVDWSKLQDRSGVTYLPNTDKPFSGYAKRTYDNGQIDELSQYKDGHLVKINGWKKNGTLYREANIKNDDYDGLRTRWYENGQKEYVRTYKNGKLEGPMTNWYENGQKKSEANFKDGKLMSAVAWKPNGEKCPETDVKDGNGVAVGYNEDGTEWGRLTYKDGVVVYY